MGGLRHKKKKDLLGERIITCNNVKVFPTNYGWSDNIGRDKVLCSCDSIVLLGGYLHHITLNKCTEYHAIIKSKPMIINYLP